MADNVTIDPGTTPSKTMATDEISSVHYQRVKLIFGADGVNSGDVASGNPLPVNIVSPATVPVSISGTQPVSIAAAVTTTTQRSSLTASSPTAATVGTSSGTVIASNGSRKGLVLVNTSSTATVSLAIGTTAVLNSGITLLPQTGWVMDEFTFTTGAINGIASAVSTNVSIQEFT